jgi:four helix bundle protein
LVVWQKAHYLARGVLRACREFPHTDEARIIKGQVIRSATSIPANIAEGFGGNKGKAFQNSLTIARREAGETDYWLLLSLVAFDEVQFSHNQGYSFNGGEDLAEFWR